MWFWIIILAIMIAIMAAAVCMFSPRDDRDDDELE